MKNCGGVSEICKGWEESVRGITAEGIIEGKYQVGIKGYKNRRVSLLENWGQGCGLSGGLTDWRLGAGRTQTPAARHINDKHQYAAQVFATTFTTWFIPPFVKCFQAVFTDEFCQSDAWLPISFSINNAQAQIRHSFPCVCVFPFSGLYSKGKATWKFNFPHKPVGEWNLWRWWGGLCAQRGPPTQQQRPQSPGPQIRVLGKKQNVKKIMPSGKMGKLQRHFSCQALISWGGGPIIVSYSQHTYTGPRGLGPLIMKSTIILHGDLCFVPSLTACRKVLGLFAIWAQKVVTWP